MKSLSILIITAILSCLFPLSALADDFGELGHKRVKPITQPRLDVVFVIDATGSMSDEIEVIKKEVWNIANELVLGNPRPDIRFGLVFYKDQQDDFVVKTTGLTRDIDKIHKLLMDVSVNGGGDNPEHVGKGLDEAIKMSWDTGSGISRMIYLVGDAPGHTYNDGFTVENAIKNANNKKIIIHTIACSGIASDGGREQFAMIAQNTGGQFQSLTYHAIVENNGKRNSVIYHDGELYESDDVIADEDWKRGAEVLVREGKVKPAKATTRSKAKKAKKRNNLDDMVKESVKDEAEDMGVVY